MTHQVASARNRPRPAPFGQFDEQVRATTTPGTPDFVAIQGTAEFIALRRRLRLFIFPMSAFFFCWYMTYVGLAAYDRPLMSHKLYGQINVGLVFGVLQFLSTVLITVSYVRYSRSRIDPNVDLVRAEAGVTDA